MLGMDEPKSHPLDVILLMEIRQQSTGELRSVYFEVGYGCCKSIIVCNIEHQIPNITIHIFTSKETHAVY